MSHIISYGFEPTAHKYHQTQADPSGNIKVVVGGAMLEDTDQIVSKLTDMSQHTNLCQSRLNNIQNHLTQDGLGGGTSHGVMLDSCASRLGDISSNSALTASRLNNCQVDLAALEVLQTTTNTLLTTLDAVVDNVLVKNTEIDVACDLNNSRGDELFMDTHTAQISNGAIAQGALMSASGGAEIDMVGSTGYQYRSITIYGKTSSAGAKLHFAGASSSGGTFYVNPTFADLIADNAGAFYHFVMTWENCPFRYVDVYASSAPAGLYLSTIKSKHR